MKKLLATAAVLALVIPQAARAADPVRIGLVMPYSAGPYVPLANELGESLIMALEESGMEVAGRKIIVLKEDTTHKPDIAQAKAKKLVFEFFGGQFQDLDLGGYLKTICRISYFLDGQSCLRQYDGQILSHLTDSRAR